MKLTMVLLTGGMLFLSGLSNVHAGLFSTDDAEHHEGEQAPFARRLPIESHALGTVNERQECHGLVESDCNSKVASNDGKKVSSDRVGTLIKRSRHGVQITFARRPDGFIHREMNSSSLEFDVPSRICSLDEDSVEPTSVKRREPSVFGEVHRKKRGDLFGVTFSHMPGITSLMLTTLDLIGVVAGCFRQRRSFVV